MATVDNRLPTEGTQKDIVDALGTIAQSLSNTSGHTIVNPAGTAMASRANLQFKDAHITDDSVNNTTKVQVIKEVTTAQFANETEQGLYRITDKPDSVINAEQVAYGSGNVKQALDSMEFKAGDSFELTLDQYVVFMSRLGFSRTRAFVSFSLPRIIKATNVSITYPSSCMINAIDESRNCTISAMTKLSITQNILTTIITISPSTAWTNVGDCMSAISFSGNVKFTFS